MKLATPGVKLTYDDFLLFPDDGKRHELIDGEHYATPSPNESHQRISGNLHFAIRAWLSAHPIGRVYYAPFDVVFSDFDVVEPDLLYLSHERAAAALTPMHVRGELVRVYRLADGVFARPAEHSRERGDILTTPLLPGFELPLSAVFAAGPAAA